MITVYTRVQACPYCDRLKTALEDYDLPYEEVVIGRDLTREEFREKFPNATTVPLMVHKGETFMSSDTAINHVRALGRGFRDV
jgi:glutaredoxin